MAVNDLRCSNVRMPKRRSCPTDPMSVSPADPNPNPSKERLSFDGRVRPGVAGMTGDCDEALVLSVKPRIPAQRTR